MPKNTSKTAIIRKLLRRPKGASIAQLQTATQWQTHSLRAALTRLSQAGHNVERLPAAKGDASRYRIISDRPQAGS